MKKIIISLIFIMFSFLAISQVVISNQKVDLDEIEVTPPKFTGIENVNDIPDIEDPLFIKNYILKNVNYPKDAVEGWFSGTEVVQFDVTPTGELANFKVINSVHPEIDNEVIRVLQMTDGMWKPGTNNGVPVVMEKEISVTFYVEKSSRVLVEDHFVRKATAYFKKGNQQLFFKNNPKRALKNFENAIRYLPYDGALLYSRGIVKYELGDVEGAESDWARMNHLAKLGRSSSNFDLLTGNYDYSKLKGFEASESYLER